MTTLKKAREERANEKLEIQAGVQAVLPDAISHDDMSINDEMVARFNERQAAIRSGTELYAPAIARDERYAKMSGNEQTAAEITEKILKMVEKLLAKLGINISLTGENVNERHRAIAENQISKELEHLEHSKSSGEDVELRERKQEEKVAERPEEKKVEKSEKITAADVLRGGKETHRQFKVQQQEKKQEAQMGRQAPSHERGR